MARTTVDVPYEAAFPRVFQEIQNYMAEEGFASFDHHGEECYMKGSSWWSGLQMFKFEYGEDIVRISAWIEYVFFALPSRSASLEGVLGALSKARAKYRLEQLEERIKSA